MDCGLSRKCSRHTLWFRFPVRSSPPPGPCPWSVSGRCPSTIACESTETIDGFRPATRSNHSQGCAAPAASAYAPSSTSQGRRCSYIASVGQASATDERLPTLRGCPAMALDHPAIPASLADLRSHRSQGVWRMSSARSFATVLPKSVVGSRHPMAELLPVATSPMGANKRIIVQGKKVSSPIN